MVDVFRNELDRRVGAERTALVSELFKITLFFVSV